MNHPLLELDDEQLYEHVIATLKKSNPTIFFGERLRGPVDVVWNGKLFHPRPNSDDIISLDFKPPHVEPDKVQVQVATVRIHFNDLASFRFPFEGFYVYPFGAMIPHRKWLSRYQPGDTVEVVDDEFSSAAVMLTDEIFNDHMYLYFRHAVSGL